MENHHVLLVSLPAQGSINPTLQLAKNLLNAGAGAVTFATTVHGRTLITSFPSFPGLSLATFSDGSDDSPAAADNVNPVDVLVRLKRLGSQNVAALLRSLSDQGKPVTFVIYSIMLPWVADVARDLRLPSAFLSIHSATAFALYHRFFGRDGISDVDLSISVELQGLPPMTAGDLPPFLFPDDPYHSAVCPTFQETIRNLEDEPDPFVLLNTFEALEEDSIRAVGGRINMFPIGPLIPSAFSDGNDSSDKSFGCDLFSSSGNYLQWLNTKPKRSVVYVSFGSLVESEKREREEIFKALVESGTTFLWVIRSSSGSEPDDVIRDVIEDNGLFRDGDGNWRGLIVPWCSQVEVLHHESVGCFVTHCGWNSTLEGLTAGVPMICRPYFSDQMTNSMMVEKVWGVGVRAQVDGHVKGNWVSCEEMRRCLEVVMGDGVRRDEIWKNSLKWKDLAMKAARQDGSSQNYLKQFLEKLKPVSN